MIRTRAGDHRAAEPWRRCARPVTRLRVRPLSRF
jgi:hypothetical protein